MRSKRWIPVLSKSFRQQWIKETCDAGHFTKNNVGAGNAISAEDRDGSRLSTQLRIAAVKGDRKKRRPNWCTPCTLQFCWRSWMYTVTYILNWENPTAVFSQESRQTGNGGRSWRRQTGHWVGRSGNFLWHSVSVSINTLQYWFMISRMMGSSARWHHTV